MISLIAAIGKNRELGKDGKLIFRLPEDMKYFKKTTMGHPVLMGRKTWESLPRKLPGRKNIVVSRHEVEGADEVIHNLGDYLKDVADSDEEIFVIGGGMVYFEALPYASKLYLTEVEAEEPEADAFFPEFDRDRFICEIVGEGEEDNVKYSFKVYRRKDE